MAEVNFYLKNPKAKEETLINLFCSFNGIRVKYSTSEKINPRHWNFDNQKVKKSLSGSLELNNKLEKLSDDAKSIVRTLQATNQMVTPEVLRLKLDEFQNKNLPSKYTLVSFIEDYIKSIENIKAKETVSAYRNTLLHLKDYQSHCKYRLNFDTINSDFYNRFVNFLMMQKKFAINTIGKQIANFKIFLNVSTEKGINTKLDYKKFKVLWEDIETIYLNEEEILKLYNYDFSEHKKLEKQRDLFIVGCYTGLRFSDFSRIASENIYQIGKMKFIKIRTEKTNDLVAVPLHWMVEAIMGKYSNDYSNSLPPAISNQKMNDYLKDIGKVVGFNDNILVTRNKGGVKMEIRYKKYELMTTHCARRSFATNLFLQGFPAISIMKLTGHKTEKSFMKYIRVTPEQNAIKLAEHWSKQQMLKAV